MTEKEFCEAIEYICEYRQWWLRTGSFNEVIAYLEGYSHGAGLDRHGHHVFATPFHCWLEKKFSIEQFNWKSYREMFPDENESIANLPILYKEFAESEYVKNLYELDEMYRLKE